MSPASWLLWSVSLAILVLLLLVEWRRAAGKPSIETAQRSHATRFIVGLLLVIGISVVAAIFLRTQNDARELADFLLDSGEFEQVILLTEADASGAFCLRRDSLRCSV